MRVRIVCYEDVNTWILGKFAKKLNEELKKLSVDSDIAKIPDPNADINHHIIYYHYQPQEKCVDTLMVTHIDSIQKLNRLKKQLRSAKMGICMSKETVKNLIKAGIPNDKLCYINPAQDEVIKPRKLVIGLTSKVNQDGRKKQNMLIKICKNISPSDFCFEIMGSGWEKIVTEIRKMGFTVNYFDIFDYQEYIKLIPRLDYYLYFSFDEGSMGFLDALSAGVKTIVTPQGYHLDAKNGISYSIKNASDIIKTLNSIIQNRNKLINSVSSWTWENYAKQHLDIWKSILQNKKNSKYDAKNGHLFAELKYLFKPLSLYNILWSISPSFIKNHYKKIYDQRNQKPGQTIGDNYSK